MGIFDQEEEGGPKRTKSKFLALPDIRGDSEGGGEQRFPPSFAHLANPLSSSQEVYLPVAHTQNVFLAEYQQHRRQLIACGHPELFPHRLPPHAAGALGPALGPGPGSWPTAAVTALAAILLGTRNKQRHMASPSAAQIPS